MKGQEIMQIRRAKAAEAPLLAALSKEAMSEPWREQDFFDAIESASAKVFLAEAEDEIWGYVVCYHAADEGEIPSIAVRRDRRRRGAASALLSGLFEDCRKDGVAKIFLEVRSGNDKAQKLYAKAGFLHVGERKGFYSNPAEDACILMKVI